MPLLPPPRSSAQSLHPPAPAPAPAWPPSLERRFTKWCQGTQGMDPALAAAVAKHVHWILRRLREQLATEEVVSESCVPPCLPAAAITQGQSTHSPSPPSPSPTPTHPLTRAQQQQPNHIVAPDHPALRAFFLQHRLVPLASSSASAAAVSAADKGPGGQAVRALIAVGDQGWMRRQRWVGGSAGRGKINL